MIYFIEHDSQENIVHACSDPMATIVPLINRVVFNDDKGAPLKDDGGNFLSPYGFPLAEPVGIDQATYETLISDGLEKYTFNPTTGSITEKETTLEQAA